MLKGVTMKRRISILLLSSLLSFSAQAGPLSSDYEQFPSEELALAAVKGNGRHVMVVFSDYAS